MSDESFEFNFWREVLEVGCCSQSQPVSAVPCKSIDPYDVVGSGITPNNLYMTPADMVSLPNFSSSPDLPIHSSIKLFEMTARNLRL